MKKYIHCVMVGLGIASALSLITADAKAGCGVELFQNSSFDSTDPRPEALLDVAATKPSIVGMWNVKLTSGGKLIDFGYSVWNSDGTEILNSGGRAPSTENFCLGVWKEIKPSSYLLNHIALSYDPTSGKLNARIRIREDVKLASDGNSYAGIFTLDAFDAATGKTPLEHVAGKITATRVTLKTTTEVN